MAGGGNFEELANNEFFMRKLLTEAWVRDVNKDGFITKEDFHVVIQRYKDMGVAEAHLEKLKKNFDILCMVLGIADDSVKLTYDQCIANFLKCGTQLEEICKIFDTHFEIIDTNENGEISFKEWTDYYTAMGIDTKHARASFDTMDTNSDGIISKEEFRAYNIEYYTTAEDKLQSSLLYGPLYQKD